MIDTPAGWGVTLSPSDVNASGFGFALTVYASYDALGGGPVTVSIDTVRITVDYTLPVSDLSYYDNTTAADLATISSSGNDPTSGARPTVYQSYRETDPFTNNIAAIASGSDGRWDFALTSGSGATGKTYCLRTVKSTGSLIDTYSLIPEITIASPGGGGAPTTEQKLRGGQSVQNGVKTPYSL